MAETSQKEFRFDEPGHEWVATVVFVDGEPVEVLVYVWKLDSPWETNMEKDLAKVLGYKVKISDMYVGNGHGSGDLTRVRADDSDKEHKGCDHGCP